MFFFLFIYCKVDLILVVALKILWLTIFYWCYIIFIFVWIAYYFSVSLFSSFYSRESNYRGDQINITRSVTHYNVTITFFFIVRLKRRRGQLEFLKTREWKKLLHSLVLFHFFGNSSLSIFLYEGREVWAFIQNIKIYILVFYFVKYTFV